MYNFPNFNKSMLLLGREPPSRSYPQPLTIHNHRYSQDAEQEHKHAKDAERKSRTSLCHPSSHKKGPAEADDGTEDDNHDETVSADGVVGFNQLWRALV
jgi:hypothetical protein